MPSDEKPKSQPDRFIDAARELGCDEDEARWEKRLREVAKHKPKDEVDEPSD